MNHEILRYTFLLLHEFCNNCDIFNKTTDFLKK
jgi:hypothetical protein